MSTFHCRLIIIIYFYQTYNNHIFLSDPSAQFSRENLGLPEVTYAPHLLGEGSLVPMNEVSVNLTCKGTVLNGMGQWKNVTYLIEWFVEGKLLKTEKICDVQQRNTHKDLVQMWLELSPNYTVLSTRSDSG